MNDSRKAEFISIEHAMNMSQGIVMKAERTRSEKKIYELQLLLTIREYDRTHGHMGWPPTAWNLFDLRMYFAPSLTRIDTLRQWLLRHRGRTLRILPGYRPFRYELTRQGERRIAYLQNHDKSAEDFRRKRNAAELERLTERPRMRVYIWKRSKREIDRTSEELEPLRKAMKALRRRLLDKQSEAGTRSHQNWHARAERAHQDQ